MSALLLFPGIAIGYLIFRVVRRKEQVKIKYHYKFTVHIPDSGPKRKSSLRYTD